MKKSFRILISFLAMSMPLVVNGNPLSVKQLTVKGLETFIQPPLVYVTDTRVFLVSSEIDGGRDVVELDLALNHVQAAYRIRPGQGPCEGNGLETVGGMSGKLYFLRHGSNEIVAFDKKGACQTVCRGIDSKNRGTFIQPTGNPDCFAVSRLRFKGGRVSADVMFVEDFSITRTLISGLVARPLPPTIFLAGNILVATSAAENTRHLFRVHLVDTDGRNKRDITVPFVSPKTKYEIRKGRAELKQHGLSLPDRVLKQKRLASGVLGDEIDGQVFFIETVEHSEVNRKKYLHRLNVKTGETGLLEIPFHFIPRTIIGGACFGFMENEEGDFNLAVMELSILRCQK